MKAYEGQCLLVRVDRFRGESPLGYLCRVGYRLALLNVILDIRCPQGCKRLATSTRGLESIVLRETVQSSALDPIPL